MCSPLVHIRAALPNARASTRKQLSFNVVPSSEPVSDCVSVCALGRERGR